ncbi:Hypothetical protein D9617_3g018390 [Elsinoe fawcettii]|nr:Hypothetical protein D9617_3g018390 [Elsinoe fawcettii]
MPGLLRTLSTKLSRHRSRKEPTTTTASPRPIPTRSPSTQLFSPLLELEEPLVCEAHAVPLRRVSPKTIYPSSPSSTHSTFSSTSRASPSTPPSDWSGYPSPEPRRHKTAHFSEQRYSLFPSPPSAHPPPCLVSPSAGPPSPSSSPGSSGASWTGEKKGHRKQDSAGSAISFVTGEWEGGICVGPYGGFDPVDEYTLASPEGIDERSGGWDAGWSGEKEGLYESWEVRRRRTVREKPGGRIWL